MMKPRARRIGLIVQELDEEVLVYDTDRATAHCLNRTAGLVWRWSDGETGVAELARRLRRTLGLGREDPTLVVEALRCLRSAHLLEEPGGLPDRGTRRPRRDALRRLARLAGTASLLPVVTTIVAPRAAEAATCVPIDGSCTSPAQCCPNNQNIKCCRNGRCANGVGNCCTVGVNC
jgi:hypothetical protein